MRVNNCIGVICFVVKYVLLFRKRNLARRAIYAVRLLFTRSST